MKSGDNQSQQPKFDISERDEEEMEDGPADAQQDGDDIEIEEMNENNLSNAIDNDSHERSEMRKPEETH